MCATCQCYLESETSLADQSDSELDMLDQAFFVKSNSRLGCQIQLDESINGIILRLAPESRFYFKFSSNASLNFSYFGRTTIWQYGLLGFLFR